MDDATFVLCLFVAVLGISLARCWSVLNKTKHDLAETTHDLASLLERFADKFGPAEDSASPDTDKADNSSAQRRVPGRRRSKCSRQACAPISVVGGAMVVSEGNNSSGASDVASSNNLKDSLFGGGDTPRRAQAELNLKLNNLAAGTDHLYTCLFAKGAIAEPDFRAHEGRRDHLKLEILRGKAKRVWAAMKKREYGSSERARSFEMWKKAIAAETNAEFAIRRKYPPYVPSGHLIAQAKERALGHRAPCKEFDICEGLPDAHAKKRTPEPAETTSKDVEDMMILERAAGDVENMSKGVGDMSKEAVKQLEAELERVRSEIDQKVLQVERDEVFEQERIAELEQESPSSSSSSEGFWREAERWDMEMLEFQKRQKRRDEIAREIERSRMDEVLEQKRLDPEGDEISSKLKQRGKSNIREMTEITADESKSTSAS